MGVAAGTQTFLKGNKHTCPWEPPCLSEGAVTSQSKPSTHRLWIGKRPQSVIVFLPCCIPEAQVHWLSIHHHIGRIIIKPANEEFSISDNFVETFTSLYRIQRGSESGKDSAAQFQWGQSAFLTHTATASSLPVKFTV